MALTSSSLLVDAMAQYNDNLRWRGDLTKAKNLHEAVLWLLANRTEEKEVGSHKMKYTDLQELEKKLDEWIAANDTTLSTTEAGRSAGGTNRYFEFGDFR